MMCTPPEGSPAAVTQAGRGSPVSAFRTNTLDSSVAAYTSVGVPGSSAPTRTIGELDHAVWLIWFCHRTVPLDIQRETAHPSAVPRVAVCPSRLVSTED